MNPKIPEKPNELFRKYYRSLEPVLQKPKYRIYTTTVLSFLTVSVLIWYAIRPTLQTILALRREIHDNIAVNEQMETKIAALVEAQAAYQNAKPRLGLLKEAVPEDPDIVDLMIQLRNLARNVDATVSGVSIATVPLVIEKNKSITPETSPSPNQPPNQNETSTLLNISVEGSYESMKQFILGIYSLRRTATIIDISLIPIVNKVESQKDNALSMKLKILVYSKNE
jgi:Tfp pilus assembly protein PilO